MHAATFGRRWLSACAAVVCAMACGCRTPVAPAEAEPATPLGANFDAASAGPVAGRVLWEGDVPVVPPFKAYANRSFPVANQFVGEKPNPHAPQVDPQSRGVRHAVAYLDKVDVDRSRPWDHGPVRIVVRTRELHVEQGSNSLDGVSSIVGFVRQGDEVELVNDDVTYHLIRARGAAFFSLPFAVAHEPVRRRLGETGLVELSAGAGQFWMRSYVFVAEHPYYALSDAAGRFELSHVPAGDYDLIVWLPNWRVERLERDPEVGLVSRIVYAAPWHERRRIRVEAGQRSAVTFRVAAAQFAGRE